MKKEVKKKADHPENVNNLRLPPPTVEHCIICFKPCMEDLTFEGSEIIKMTITQNNTREILLHAVDLIITKAIWEEDVTMNRQEPSELRFEEKGILKLIFDPSLVEQTGCLRMNFKGNMSDKRLAGFFVYNTAPLQHEETELGGQPKKQLNMITEFDPCEARRCFPCWDDPKIKMTFDIILVIPKNMTVLGPTPVKATFPHKRDPNLEVAEFKTTPKLCTHSLGFAFGTYESIEKRSDDDETLIRIYTPPGKKEEAEFALSLTSRALPYFTQYFGAPLKLQKLDLVAVPDFISSPIECWGLIFYRSSDILVEPITAVKDLMWISLILCHEITKQWFGGLTTFEWFTHQWLKEGFAAFAKYIFVNQQFPELEVWTHFVTHVYQKALKIDALRFSHPIEVQVTSIAEIEESVDEICLQKAPSLLRMVHRFVGDVNFRQGLKLYLTKYRYGNATTTEFWSCLQEASSKPVVNMMTSWTQHKGYPVITVTTKQEGKNRMLKLNQERFVYEQSHRDVKGQGQSWSIPLTFSTRNNPMASVLDVVMDGKTINVTIPDLGKSDWVKVNPGSVGFYRVRYPHEMFSALVFAIREKSLPPLDRLNILDDTFAFLIAGIGTTVELLSLLEAYVEDDDYSVWTTISYIFDKFLAVFDHVGKAESFMSFGRYIYQTIYSKLGWHGSDDELLQRKLLRSLVLRMLTKFNFPEVVQKCKAMFEAQYAEVPVQIPVDLRFTVYKSVVMHGDDAMIKRFMRLYRECDSVDERDKLSYALGTCRSPQQLQSVLEFSISDDVRRAHTAFILTSMGKTKLGKDLGWNFFKENFNIFRNRYGPHQGSNLLHALLENYVSEDKVTEILEFFKTNPYPGTEWAVQQIVESIKLNELWLKREKNLTALQDYLEFV